MWIIVYVLLDLEHFVLCLQIHAECDIERLIFVTQCIIVSILHITASIFSPQVFIDIFLDKLIIEVFQYIVFALQINDRALSTLLVNQHNRGNAGFFGNESIIGAKVRSNMHDTCTVFCCYIVAKDNAKGSVCHRFDTRNELFILHSFEFCTHKVACNLPRNHLVTLLVAVQVGIFSCLVEISRKACFSHDHGNWLTCIRIVALYADIFYFWSNAESAIGRQCPRGRCPCEEIGCAPLFLKFDILKLLDLELCRTRCVLHITVASRLVQFM